jgi:hypothetical protein
MHSVRVGRLQSFIDQLGDFFPGYEHSTENRPHSRQAVHGADGHAGNVKARENLAGLIDDAGLGGLDIHEALLYSLWQEIRLSL